MSEVNVAETVENTNTQSTPEAAPVVPPSEGVTTEAPKDVYTPNLKFRVLGKEHEFEDWSRPLLSKDTEAKFRELYEKAYALDPIREKGLKAQQEKEELVAGLQHLEQLRQQSPREFLSKLNFPKELIYQMVLEDLRAQEMSPEQRQEWEQNQQFRKLAFEKNQEAEQFKTNYQQQLSQMREMQVDSAIMRPEIQAMIGQYDARRESPGAFKSLVYMVGNNHFNATGQDMPVEQAIKEALAICGQHVQQTQPAPQSAPQAPTQKPVIPNLGSGGGSSVVEQTHKSIADIEQYYNNKFGRK